MPQPFAVADTLIWSSVAGVVGSQPNRGASAPNFNVNGASPVFDVHAYKSLVLEILLGGFTGGTTPSFQPEWDMLDDDTGGAGPGGANVIPLWQPAAATAATKWIEFLGASNGAAPTITGWVVGAVSVDAGPWGRIAWTVAGGPTSVNGVKMFLYGKHI